METTGIDQADPNGMLYLPFCSFPLYINDLLFCLAFFVAFSEQSGGIFLDFGIHTVSTNFLSFFLFYRQMISNMLIEP